MALYAACVVIVMLCVVSIAMVDHGGRVVIGVVNICVVDISVVMVVNMVIVVGGVVAYTGDLVGKAATVVSGIVMSYCC